MSYIKHYAFDDDGELRQDVMREGLSAMLSASEREAIRRAARVCVMCGEPVTHHNPDCRHAPDEPEAA